MAAGLIAYAILYLMRIYDRKRKAVDSIKLDEKRQKWAEDVNKADINSEGLVETKAGGSVELERPLDVMLLSS